MQIYMPEPCIAYAHKQECNIWNSELWGFKQLYNGNNDGLDIYICLAASDPLIQDSEKKAHRVRLIVLIAVLGSIFYSTMWSQHRCFKILISTTFQPCNSIFLSQ